MKKIVGFGDFLLSLSAGGYRRFIQADSFDAFYTGAEANVCASLAKFGMDTEFVTRLPENDIADAGIANLRKYNVGTSHIARGGDRMGVIYMERGAAQRPSKVIYDRRPSGFCDADGGTFDWEDILKDADWLHFTGITPALSDTLPEACLAACKAAKAKNITISCDLNYRKNLWTTQQAGAVMRQLLPYVDVLIANEEDVEKVLGIRAGDSDVISGKLNYDSYAEVAARLSAEFGLTYVATTLRKSISASDNEWRAMLYHNGETLLSKQYMIHIVNRVGGGDSFSAGLIYGLINGMSDRDALEYATAASCLKHSIEDDFNLVSVQEVLALMNGDASGRVQR